MREDTYIIYDPATMQVVKTFPWCGQAIKYARKHNLAWLNRTHPKHKEILARVRQKGG